jgi:methionine-rich copper-binding protein CopC
MGFPKRDARRLGTALLVAFATTALSAVVRAAPAADWTIQPPAQSTVSASDSLTVAVPADLSGAQLASLAVELDHIDVTALVHIGDGRMTYRPPQPLGSGSHELRVVEYASDGHLVAHGAWAFAVDSAAQSAAAKRGWSVKGSVGATGSERVADSDLTPPPPPRTTVNGTFDVKAVAMFSEWTAEATVNGLYGSDNGISAIGGQGVQPAQMQLAIKHAKDSLVIGDQTLPFDNLLISGLSRRGVSGHLADMPLSTDATAFSMRDSALAGFYGGLGVGDSNDLVSGAVVETHPIPGSPKALTVTAGLVSGSSPGGLATVVPYPGGNGVFPPNPPLGSVTSVQSGSGSAWGAGATSELLGSSLKLNAQFAGSNFDFPGTSGQPSTHASDTAYMGGVNYGNRFAHDWTYALGLSYQNVGTFFTSLANPTLPPDRRTATATGTVGGHGLSLAASGGFTEDNTDDNASVATVRSLPRSLTVSYAPALSTSVTSWLGTPSISVARQDARTHNITAPSGSEPTDSDVVNGTVTLNFAYPHLSWQAGVMDGTFRDYTGQQDDTDTFGPTFGINLALGGGFVGFNMQLLDAHDLKQDTHTLDHNYTLSAGDSFLSGKLSAQLTLAINRNTQQVVPGLIPPQLVGSDVQLKTATAQLSWHAIAPTRSRGGLDVGLSSSWNESTGLNTAALTTQGFSALATRGMQTFLTLTSKWPLELGDR